MNSNIIERPIISVENIQDKLLHILCSSSGGCIAFGRFTEIIDQYFEYLDFKYLISPILRIGKPSVNGFINEFIFQRNQYKLFTILKSSQNEESDNLLYEYIVGKEYINNLITKLPCFVKTYGLY